MTMKQETAPVNSQTSEESVQAVEKTSTQSSGEIPGEISGQFLDPAVERSSEFSSETIRARTNSKTRGEIADSSSQARLPRNGTDQNHKVELSEWQNRLLNEWRTLKISKCESPVWARGGHIQTLLGFLISSPKVESSSEEIFITLPDDEILHARVIAGSSPTVVYLFHGLGGSIESNYIQRTARIAQAMGLTVVMANHRGSGEGKELAKKPYHSGSSNDLSSFIAYGRNRWPNHRHLSVGFSLSANASILLAAGHDAPVQPDAAIAVNAPLDLARCSVSLTSGLNRIYDRNFMRDMRALVKDRTLEGKSIEIKKNATLYDFDEIYTAPASGFLNRKDYYERCSGQKFASDISIPTFVIHAEDDPFIPGAIFHETKFSDRAVVHIEKSGGHLGYLTSKAPAKAPGAPDFGIRWLDATLHRLIAITKATV